jgi:integrase
MQLFLPANDNSFASPRARSLPVLSSMSAIRGYPSKLKIYRIRGSRFWQARCYINGKMHVRSTRALEKQQAIEIAKKFYEELLLRYRSDGEHELAHLERAQQKATPPKFLFDAVAERALAGERGRMMRGELAMQSFKALRNRLQKQISPALGREDIRSITHDDLQRFVDKLVERKVSSVTMSQYLQSVRLVFKFALVNELIDRIPPFPKLRLSSQPRGGFTVSEYKQLLRASKQLARTQEEPKQPTHRNRAGGIFTRTESVPDEMVWMIGFMVNSFLRPTDLKYIQHKHVEIVRTSHLYLRLTIPETKRHKAQIVTLRPAVRIYQSLRRYQEARGVAKPDDYLFLPQVDDRDAASVVLSSHFNKILQATGLKTGELGQVRSLYSLRHTAIMFRLLYGKGIDLLTLARNARTSVQMIEQFYASNLTAEMNIGLLQSRRRPSMKQGVLELDKG